MNDLYHQLNRGVPSDIVSRFNQFAQSVKGNPQQIIQQMLNSGKISQAQFNQAVQMANRMKGLFGIR